MIDPISPPPSLPPQGRVERFPIAPDTVTVLGSRWKADAPWSGLDFTKARIRTQSTLMLYVCGPADEAPYDLHLDVPWCHPNDQPWGWDDEMVYRVRPIAEPGKRWRRRMVRDVAIEPAPGKDPPWEIVVTFGPLQGLSRG